MKRKVVQAQISATPAIVLGIGLLDEKNKLLSSSRHRWSSLILSRVRFLVTQLNTFIRGILQTLHLTV